MTERRLMTREELELAACRHAPLALFFPEPGDDLRPALAYCERCPVRDACLQEALSHPEHGQGIRGGRSERSRKGMRNRRGMSGRLRNECPSRAAYLGGRCDCDECRSLNAGYVKARRRAAS